jgi:CDP-glycerol glycerophosphotransferase
MTRLSLIMPVYNVEAYLAEAIASVRAQTMTDFELILVNDGSTDTSREIAEQACAQDDRFTLVDQANSGPGPGGGRNGGLSTASGDLLMFMDSDDVITPTTFERMVALFDHPGQQMVTTSARRLAGVRIRRSTIHDLSHPEAEISTTARQSPWLMFDTTPWNKMFRRTFFDDVVGQWPAQQLYEDIAPMTACHLRSQSTGVLTEGDYLWRLRSDGSSITQSRRGIDGDLAQLEQLRLAADSVAAFGDEAVAGWFAWKAYTFDFIWMLRKLPVLDQEVSAQLHVALQSAMNHLGTNVVGSLPDALRSCVDAVLTDKPRQAKMLAARHRLSLVPDRRRFDRAVHRPHLDAVLLADQPRGRNRELVTSTMASAGEPTLALSPVPPWHNQSEPTVETIITPDRVRRRGPRTVATFTVKPVDIADGENGQTTFMHMRAGGAEGELQRSLRDRVTSRIARPSAPNGIDRVFEGTNVVLVGEPQLPRLDRIEFDDGSVHFRGQLDDAGDADFARMTDAEGRVDERFPLITNDNTFHFSLHTSALTPGIEYFLAVINSNNSGLSRPISVASTTFISASKTAPIMVGTAMFQQAYFRCNTNDFRSITRQVRDRFRIGG